MIISTYVMHCLAMLPEGVNCRKTFPAQWAAPLFLSFHGNHTGKRMT